MRETSTWEYKVLAIYWKASKPGKLKEHMRTGHLMHETVYLFFFCKEHSLNVL